MSGHSKWATTKHQKAVEDKKKAKIFSRLSKAISLASRSGGPDSQSNAKLRFTIEQARSENMPKENIKRAIEKGTGQGSEGQLQEVVYEGFGPEKVGVIVECITDNKNRTSGQFKSFFEKSGGNLASPGAVTYLFKRMGLIEVAKEAGFEAQALKLIDLGIDDFEERPTVVAVYTAWDQLDQLKSKIEQAKFQIVKTEICYRPITLIPVLEANKKDKLLQFLHALDDLEDVQKVFCNADLTK